MLFDKEKKLKELLVRYKYLKSVEELYTKKYLFRRVRTYIWKDEMHRY